MKKYIALFLDRFSSLDFHGIYSTKAKAEEAVKQLDNDGFTGIPMYKEVYVDKVFCLGDLV